MGEVQEWITRFSFPICDKVSGLGHSLFGSRAQVQKPGVAHVPLLSTLPLQSQSFLILGCF